jgi:hypothetical protein
MTAASRRTIWETDRKPMPIRFGREGRLELEADIGRWENSTFKIQPPRKSSRRESNEVTAV